MFSSIPMRRAHGRLPTMHALNSIVSHRTALRATAVAAALAALAGCSTVENFLAGDKVDYRIQSVKTAPLDVPPDLTQLQRDGRFATSPSGSVSASAYQAAASAPATAKGSSAAPAPVAASPMRIPMSQPGFSMSSDSESATMMRS